MRFLVCAIWALGLALLGTPQAHAESRIHFGPKGHMGFWAVREHEHEREMVAPKGTVKNKSSDVTKSTWEAVCGESSRDAAFRWIAYGDGPVDLTHEIGVTSRNAGALLVLPLEVDADGTYWLLTGADGALEASLDDTPIYTREHPHPYRANDDIIRVDLTKGRHTIALALRQRRGPWVFDARLVDAAMRPPSEVHAVACGLSDDDLRAKAEAASMVRVERHVSGARVEVEAMVHADGGFPESLELPVHVRWATKEHTWFDAPAGKLRGGTWRVRLPTLSRNDLSAAPDTDMVVEVKTGTRLHHARLTVKPAWLDTLAHAEAVQRKIERDPAIKEFWKTTLEHHARRLASFMEKGDHDLDATDQDAKTLEQISTALEGSRDPLETMHGALRFAYRSPLDGNLAEFALYVPAGYEPSKPLPLVVTLHGLNGKPISMLQWTLGHDDGAHDADWEDRHVARLPNPHALILAPDGHGNTMYREAGEADVASVVDLVRKEFAVDPGRISITGVSMGGTGTTHVAFRYPGVYAAAEPLCGYHSYFLRNDMGGLVHQPWERLIAEERSTVEWSSNGLHIPLFVVHGKKDLPEENSGVLIKRYKRMGYTLKDEHPDLGHNVWDETYKDLDGVNWLLGFRKREQPSRVHFRTLRLRYDTGAWIHLLDLQTHNAWSEIDATWIKGRGRIEVRTSNARVIAVDRGALNATEIRIDGDKVALGNDARVVLIRERDHWVVGHEPDRTGRKNEHTSGPLRDIFRTPLVFVYGTKDERFTRANEEVAHHWATPRYGVRLKYPVLSDDEYLAKQDSLAGGSVFFVGGPATNSALAPLANELPIQIEAERIVVGKESFEGADTGVAFVAPHPKRPERYVAVVAGLNPIGTLRSIALPELLPDYIVYDRAIAAARGGQVLGKASIRAGGFFTADWRVLGP